MKTSTRATLGTAACSALLVLGCGGGSHMDGMGGTQAKSLSATESLRATESFLQVEGRQSQPGFLPYTLAPGGGPALPAVAPAACGVTTLENPAPGVIRISVDFNGCPKEVTAVLSGHMVITITANPPGWSVDYSPITAVSGTQTWQLSGMKGVSKDTARMELTIQTQNLAMAYSDSANPANNRAYSYTSNLTGSWATAGEYRVWGTYALTTTADGTLTATIDKTQPLIYSAGCCYPGAGTIHFTRNGAAADATFLAPCGTVKIQPAAGPAETRTLAACN